MGRCDSWGPEGRMLLRGRTSMAHGLDYRDGLDMKKPVPLVRRTGSVGLWAYINSGSDLFSRAVAHQVSSALESLTSVFGMGTGGPLRYNHQKSGLQCAT